MFCPRHVETERFARRPITTDRSPFGKPRQDCASTGNELDTSLNTNEQQPPKNGKTAHKTEDSNPPEPTAQETSKTKNEEGSKPEVFVDKNDTKVKHLHDYTVVVTRRAIAAYGDITPQTDSTVSTTRLTER